MFIVIERKLQNETPKAPIEIQKSLFSKNCVWLFERSITKAIKPRAAKNIFVFTDGNMVKKKGKKKKLVNIVIIETCIALIMILF